MRQASVDPVNSHGSWSLQPSLEGHVHAHQHAATACARVRATAFRMTVMGD